MIADWIRQAGAGALRAHAETLLRRGRADYYEYLAERMQAGAGAKTLLDLFLDDARRYGPGTPRGSLSHRWAVACQEQGADIYLIWQGVFPDEELLLLRIAQQSGAEAFAQTLADLAAAVRLITQVRRDLLQTVGVGLAALAVLLAMLAAVPYYTAPRLWHAFQGVPHSHLGPAAKAFREFATALERGWPWLAAGVTALAAGCLASLPLYTGALRAVLDRVAPWSLYRDFQALRFLALLALLVRRRGHRVMALREALGRIAGGASRWMAWQAQRMCERMDLGAAGASIFDTGLLERETLWFMQDMIDAHGMDQGLLRGRSRLETRAVRRLVRQSRALRWLLLLASLACLFGLLAWHYGVVDELRRALMLHQAS